MTIDGNREELLVAVATLYYEFNQSQQQIADRLEISRSSVSRLIAEAKQRGIVTIHIRKSVSRDFAVEQEMVTQFALHDALVLRTTGRLDVTEDLQTLGRLAATYLQRVVPGLPEKPTIGVAWGTSVQATLQALPEQLSQHVDVMQLLGGVGTLVVDAPDLARMVAAKLGGFHYDLPAPVLVAHPAARDMLLAEPSVQRGLSRARGVDLAITGIGTTRPEASSFLRAELISHDELVQLRSDGAVGEMCGRFFDIHGNHAVFDINQRIVGIELEDLQHVPRVLAIARGVQKVHSILGALRGRFFNVLATDDVTARAILSLV